MYQKPALKTPLISRYSNKESYSTYLLQDFEGTVHSVIRDQIIDLELNIRSVFDCKQYWQTQIDLSQGFMYTPGPTFPGYPVELVLYFYSVRPEENMTTSRGDNYLLVNSTNGTYKITFSKDALVASQTLS